MNKLVGKVVVNIVVKFLYDKDPSGKALIEIVPRNWLHLEKDQWFCWYPPKKDEQFGDKWAREEKLPEKGWKSFEVKILKDASNHEQRLRRLKRALVSFDIKSSSSESILSKTNKTETPVILSPRSSNKLLNSTPRELQTSKEITNISNFDSDSSDSSSSTSQKSKLTTKTIKHFNKLKRISNSRFDNFTKIHEKREKINYTHKPTFNRSSLSSSNSDSDVTKSVKSFNEIEEFDEYTVSNNQQTDKINSPQSNGIICSHKFPCDARDENDTDSINSSSNESNSNTNSEEVLSRETTIPNVISSQESRDSSDRDVSVAQKQDDASLRQIKKDDLNEIQTIIKSFLKEAKEKIIREIRKSKRSLQYDINNKFSTLTNNLGVNLGFKKTNALNTLHETVLGIALPTQDLTAFDI